MSKNEGMKVILETVTGGTVPAGLVPRLGITHDITTPSCAFSNGSVERVNREIRKLSRDTHGEEVKYPYVAIFITSRYECN